MSVLFTHGYFLADDPKEMAIMKPYPPLGLLYLSAWLDKHGVQNSVYDTTFSDRQSLETHIEHSQPRILALYANLMTKPALLRILRFVRELEARHPGYRCLKVLGGPDVTHNAEAYLREGADLIVIGEGEQTMLELALAAEAAGDTDDLHARFQHVPGLAYLHAGFLHKTAAREKIRDLEQLPFPNRHKIELQRYLDAWKKAHGHNALSISTQRGCPYTCRWCSTAVYGQSYRRRSPESVVDEIEFLQKNYQFDLVWFVDDVFTVSHKWLGEFHQVLQARGVQLQFECITRADRLNHEVLRLLRACGCFRVWIGAESGSQRIIDAMDRRVDVQQVRSMIRAARAEGIQAGTFIMLGYPGETEADIRETVRHLKEANPDLFTITVAYPIKGTGLYEEVQATATAPLPWAESTDRDVDFPRSYPRRYYDYALRWTVNAVHLHKARLEGKALSARGLKLLLKTLAARTGMFLSG
jgi:radical SAM superfamily enzyme YgiQ (UPF0313 family)